MLPHPPINRARNLFQALYRDKKINVKISRQTLREQLDLYLDHLSAHLDQKIATKDHGRIYKIIERNNQVAKILDSPTYRQTISRKKELLGDVAVGVIFCIDGRIPTIFLGGRFVKHWEVPAGEIVTTKRKSDQTLIPESSELSEALRNMVSSGKDILEIVFAHTSLSDPHHGCGAMAAKKKNGIVDKNANLEEANLEIIEQKTIPALTNLYNEFRVQKGLDPLDQIGVPALYDTDTFGIVLNYQSKSQDQTLSTTILTSKYKNEIDDFLIKDHLFFGMFREKFSELKYLTVFSQNTLKITTSLMFSSAFLALQEEIKSYIDTHYQKLSANQKKALGFLLFRNITFQFLTGFCSIPKKGLDHPFSEHEEEYMAVSTRGNTIGKFDPKYQGFSSTPADATTAISHIKVKLSLMNVQKNNKNRPYILFVCNPIEGKNLRENDGVIHRVMTSNAQVLRDILSDETLGQMVEKGEIIPVPVLISDDTREVLKIADHSAYI